MASGTDSNAGASAGVVVVGAGLSGLTIAVELARAGRQVTVLERESAPGGLARTFRRSGLLFDIGPHRFHTEDAGVDARVREVLGDDALEIRRRSAVRAFGRTIEWPLRPAALAALPLGVMLRGARDLLRRQPPAGESFEAEMVARYGRTLYDLFFEPYTRRFVGLEGAEIHRDWARAGVDRAVIDRRVRAGALADLLRGLLLPRPVETTFIYPRQGIGRFAAGLAQELQRVGGRLLLGRHVDGLVGGAGRVEEVCAGGERFAAGLVVWTGPLQEACRLLAVPAPGLAFLSTVLHVVRLRRPSPMAHQWTYFGEEPAFVRVTNPLRFTPAAAPLGEGILCVESTCREGDARWERPEAETDAVIAGLRGCGAIRSRTEVSGIVTERVRDSYPVYSLDYRFRRTTALDGLRRFGNLLPAGRCGRYWYNNMDHSIAQGLRIAARLLAGEAPAMLDVGGLDYWADQRSAGAPSVVAGR